MRTKNITAVMATSTTTCTDNKLQHRKNATITQP